ncbi:hypothetical protein [Cupriavidus metallidurans]|uniref:hypothetical protein n=1 Tax=Cupriavidus metallidurans TaxID=119219 RepID=UPI00164891FC|nr:hypothetical protein [Cupriavidus metallidurans]
MTDHNARQAGLTDAKIDEIAAPFLTLGDGDTEHDTIDWRGFARAVIAAHSADARNGEAVALTDMRWRDVSVEKPTHAQQVLFVRNGKVHFGAWINDIFWYSNEKVCALYWMPLPEAPTLAAPAAPAPTKLDDDLLATIRTAATTRAEGATTQDGRTVFINYGDSEQQMIDADALACPHCGGSGHVADVRPAPAPAAQADGE